MRISTPGAFLQSLASLLRNQAQLAKTESQLSSGTRLVSAADAPADAAQALSLDHVLAANSSYLASIGAARSRLSLEESALSQASDVLQRVRELALQANSGSQSPETLQTIAGEMRRLNEQLLATANSTDGSGRYLFAGSRDDAPPFAFAAGVATYAGDQAQRRIDIGNDREIADSDAGSEVFMRLTAGGVPQDVFTTLDRIATLVASVPADDAARAQKQADVATALKSLDGALGHFADVRASVGNRLAVLDDVENELATRQVSVQETLSGLRDVDYAEATTRLNLQLTALQAAQQSFAKVQGLTLFNYLP